MNEESERVWKTNGWLGTTTGRKKGEDAGEGGKGRKRRLWMEQG